MTLLLGAWRLRVLPDRVGTSKNLYARIRAEYREMPGLRLTLPQASRLFSLERLVASGSSMPSFAKAFWPLTGGRSATQAPVARTEVSLVVCCQSEVVE